MSGPTISIVTPTLNQAGLIEETLESVLGGRRAPDEYVVVDGGSTDGTAAIVERHAQRLTGWSSGPDGGLYAAIASGFAATDGDVMGWLNGGDLYMPWTLDVVHELFARFPEVEWLTTLRPLVADERGRVVSCEFVGGFGRRGFRRAANLPYGPWHARAGVQQESTFWRRSLWEAAGGHLATELQQAGDFELWLRFFDHASLYALDAPLAAHRVHTGQKTAVHLDAYVAEARGALDRAGGGAPGRVASAARRAAHHALGRRPLRRLPRPLGGVLRAAGLLEPVPTIVWREGRWRVVRDWVV